MPAVIAEAAKIGVLCWETGQVPRGLLQLEALPGNSTNPASYGYPVRFHPVRGANVHTILENPNQAVLETMIADAMTMVSEGVKAITTSCGFNAIFQEWNRMFAEPKAEIDLDVIEQEVLGTALRALAEHPGIQAFVLECTDLPPYSEAIRRQSGLPVFDFITMVNFLHSAI
jgi:hypothetical protein